MRLHADGDDDGQDNVAALFPGSIPHDATDGLDDIHLGIPWGEEEHGIERGDIYAFREAADVAEDAAGVFWGRCFEPVEFFLLLAGVHGAVHVGGFADEGDVGIFLCLIGADDFLEHPGDLLGADFSHAAGGALDDLAEGDGAAHGLGITAEIFGEAFFREGLPTADDAGGVVDVELVAIVLEEV